MYEDATVLAAVIAGADGSWSFNEFRTLADGSTHNYSATATDLCRQHEFSFDNFRCQNRYEAPRAPSVPDLTDASDSGSSNTDNLTSVTKPAFTGKAEVGSTVRLVEGVVILGTAVADSAGNWSITSTTLADGVHNIAARAVDMAGNIGPASAALVVTIDTVHPLLALLSPSVPGDTNGDDNCDLQDLANVLNNLGKSSIGDVNGDGFVDAQDREIVANHLGERVPRAALRLLLLSAIGAVDRGVRDCRKFDEYTGDPNCRCGVHSDWTGQWRDFPCRQS